MSHFFVHFYFVVVKQELPQPAPLLPVPVPVVKPTTQDVRERLGLASEVLNMLPQEEQAAKKAAMGRKLFDMMMEL